MCWINIPSDSEMISNFDLWLYFAHYVKTNKSSALHLKDKSGYVLKRIIYNTTKHRLGVNQNTCKIKADPTLQTKSKKQKTEKPKKQKTLKTFAPGRRMQFFTMLFLSSFSFIFSLRDC